MLHYGFTIIYLDLDSYMWAAWIIPWHFTFLTNVDFLFSNSVMILELKVNNFAI